MDKIPMLREQVLSKSPLEYVWKWNWASDGDIHSIIQHSFIGSRFGKNWNQIYWDTACLVVNSGSLEDDEGYKEKRKKGTDYKIAKGYW